MKAVRKVAESKKPIAELPKAEQSVILKEEERRRKERNSRSLFVKGVSPKMKDSDLKNLSPDIIHVNRKKSVAWLLFNSKEACDKAYTKISEIKLGKDKLVVDFCDDRSTYKPEKQRSDSRPMNPLELVVSNLAPNTEREKLELIFKNAVHITLKHHHRYAFVRFDNEKSAREAFEKAKGLKINGQPVDVYYARIQLDDDKKADKPSHPFGAKKTNGQPKTMNTATKMPNKQEDIGLPAKKLDGQSGKKPQQTGTFPGKKNITPQKDQSSGAQHKGLKRPFKGQESKNPGKKARI